MGKFTKIGFFPGVWDLLHPGHIRALKEAKKHCDYLVVGVNGNPTRGNPSKNEPIMSWKERLEIVKEIKSVDVVMVYSDDETLFKLDKKDYWDVRFMGSDHKSKNHHRIKAEVVYIPRNHKYSTTAIRARIK